MLPTIEWQDEAVVMIDQRKLPGAEIYVKCKSAAQVAKAIKTTVIRGAPAIGVAAGGLAAVGATRLLSRMLFGVRATDPLSYALVIVTLGAISFVACYLPARRAMRLDPIVAMRAE